MCNLLKFFELCRDSGGYYRVALRVRMASVTRVIAPIKPEILEKIKVRDALLLCHLHYDVTVITKRMPVIISLARIVAF